MQQLALAAVVLVDDTLAVERMGLGSLIPLEYTRQLVLLLWDVTVAHSAAQGSNAGLPWGVGRIRALALVLLHGVGRTGDEEGDMGRMEGVVSALCLLAYESPEPAQEQPQQAPNRTELVELITGATLRLLLGCEAGEGLTAIAECYASKGDYYRSAVHFLAQDCAPAAAGWSLRLTDGSVRWSPPSAPPVALSQLVDDSWGLLSKSSFDTMGLPSSSLGATNTLALATRAVLVLLAGSTPLDTGVDGQLLRWVLAMHATFTRHSGSAGSGGASSTGSGGGGATASAASPTDASEGSRVHAAERERVSRRVLCAADGWQCPTDTYTPTFCEFQHRMRWTSIALATATTTPALAACWATDDGAALVDVFRTLRGVFPTHPSDLDRTVLCAWSDPVVRGWAEEVAGVVLDTCAALVTAADRRVTAGPTQLHLGGVADRLRRAGESLRAAVPVVSAVSALETRAARLDTTGDRPSGASLQSMFEAAPSREPSDKAVALRQTSVLFDRGAAVWRAGRAGASERVLASMLAAQGVPLSGNGAGGSGSGGGSGMGGGQNAPRDDDEEAEEDDEEDDDEEVEEDGEEDDGAMDVEAVDRDTDGGDEDEDDDEDEDGFDDEEK
jgi:hypothetical protein